jgi:DNA-binding transcriptional MerR regulator
MLLNDIKCMENNNPYLTTNEIAKLFNVRAITIYRWEKKGLIKSHRFNPKGKKLFIKEEILRLLQNKKINMFTQLNENKRAIWYPVNTTKEIKGTILFLPGFPKYPGCSEFIDFFNKEQYNVLTLMYSGTFDSHGKFSIENAVQDVKSWYQFLNKEIIQYGPHKTEKVKHKEIILFATSFGGLIAGLSLKKFIFPKINKAIFISPLWNMVAYKNNESNLQISDETSEIMSFAYPFSYRFKNKKQFFGQIKGEVLIPGIDKRFINRNIKHIIFCGRADKVTPVAMSKALEDEHQNSKLYIIDGGHSSKIEWKQFNKLIKEVI